MPRASQTRALTLNHASRHGVGSHRGIEGTGEQLHLSVERDTMRLMSPASRRRYEKARFIPASCRDWRCESARSSSEVRAGRSPRRHLGYEADRAILLCQEIVLLEDRIPLGVVPPAVPPAELAGGPLVAVAALLVDPAHRRVKGVPLDPMQAELLEGESGPSADRVAGVTLTPDAPLADHQPPRGAARFASRSGAVR